MSLRLAGLDVMTEYVLGRCRPSVADAVTLSCHPSLQPERAEPVWSSFLLVAGPGSLGCASSGEWLTYDARTE